MIHKNYLKKIDAISMIKDWELLIIEKLFCPIGKHNNLYFIAEIEVVITRQGIRVDIKNSRHHQTFFFLALMPPFLRLFHGTIAGNCSM